MMNSGNRESENEHPAKDGQPTKDESTSSNRQSRAKSQVATRLKITSSEFLLVIGHLAAVALIQGGIAFFIEPPETQKGVAVAILGSLFGAAIGYSIFVLPFLPFGMVERTYLATLTRMGLNLALALAILRQIDTPHYQLRIAIYILSAYGINLLGETILIARNLSSGNSKIGFTQSAKSPDGS